MQGQENTRNDNQKVSSEFTTIRSPLEKQTGIFTLSVRSILQSHLHPPQPRLRRLSGRKKAQSTQKASLNYGSHNCLKAEILEYAADSLFVNFVLCCGHLQEPIGAYDQSQFERTAEWIMVTQGVQFMLGERLLGMSHGCQTP